MPVVYSPPPPPVWEKWMNELKVVVSYDFLWVISLRRTKSFPSFCPEKYKNSRTLYILKLVIIKLLYYIVCSISVIICNLDLLFCKIWNPGDNFLSGYFSFKIRSMSTTSGMDAMWLSPWKHLVQKRYWLSRKWEKFSFSFCLSFYSILFSFTNVFGISC